jgi:hypothetical protein
MLFTFVTTAKNSKELDINISQILEKWYPSSLWMHELSSIEQLLVEQDESNKDQKKQVVLAFEIHVEVYPQSNFKSILVKVKKWL